MLLNFFDVETATGERCVELQVGDFPRLGLQVDLLVVSAFEGHYAPVPGTLLGRLHQAYGLRLDALEIALDLRQGPLKAWVSAPLRWDPSLLGDPPFSRFTRLVVVEGAIEWQPGDLVPWPPFNRLFSVLALLPMRGIHYATVATPLLGSGNQGIEVASHYPALLEAYREAFRYLPDLSRLILFDRTDLHLQVLGDAIDASLARVDPQNQRIMFPQGYGGLDHLDGLLRGRLPALEAQASPLAQDLAELLSLMRGAQIAPIALGIHARRVAEQLVFDALEDVARSERLNLNTGIRLLARRGADPWLISCLHQVRCFGNWMGHPQREGQRRPVELFDVLAVLSALQRILEDYPWVL